MKKQHAVLLALIITSAGVVTWYTKFSTWNLRLYTPVSDQTRLTNFRTTHVGGPRANTNATEITANGTSQSPNVIPTNATRQATMGLTNTSKDAVKPTENTKSTAKTSVDSTKGVPAQNNTLGSVRTAELLNSSSAVQTEPKLLCTAGFSGRLGNHLYVFASVTGLALKLNRIPVFGSSSQLSALLKAPFPSPEHEKYADRCSKAKRQGEGNFAKYDPGLLQLDPTLDYRVGQYLQSWKYFIDYEQEVRKRLEFKETVVAAANRVVQNFRQKYNKTLIGVHVRRGDYLLPVHKRIGYKVASTEYFQNAFSYMRIRFKNVTFVVSTDDPSWGRDSVFGSSDVIFLQRHSATQDMVVLSSLDHVIFSVGTYGWWVGFFNKGVVIYCKDYIQENTYIGDSFKKAGSDVMYPSWIPM